MFVISYDYITFLSEFFEIFQDGFEILYKICIGFLGILTGLMIGFEFLEVILSYPSRILLILSKL